MGQELVSSYLRSKLSSILEEAEADSGSPSHIISRFRSIQRQIESTEASLILEILLYDLIDALSECRVFAYQRRTPHVSKKGFNLNKLYRPLSELMFRRRIRKRLDSIDKKLPAPSPGDSRPLARLVIPLTQPIPDPSLIIGLHAEAETIEDWLMATASSDALRAVGIVGRCGCGKTALAQKVFASSKVVQEFSPRIWVCLSNMLFDNDPWVKVVKFILGVIFPAEELDGSESSLVKLLEMLQQGLIGKKYLIVLDDAWRLPGDPHFLSQGLPKGSGGAVIVTSRRKDVISQMVGDEHVIRLEPGLSGEICWQILSTDIQQQGKMYGIRPKLSVIKDDAKRNFDGLPLVAKSFATMLPDLLNNTKFEGDQMAERAVTFLLEQVKEVVKGYTDLISGAENEFNKMQNELNLLKAFLKDAGNKSKPENLFRELERQIRDVVYEVEDTIDICLTKAIEAKAKNSRRSALFSKKKYNLAKEVNSIRLEKVLAMFDDAKLKFATMQIADGSEDQRTKLKRLTTHARPFTQTQTRVVGFEDEEIIITRFLMQENENRLDVIPIIGIPGQGKTTLTWKIYQNENICYHFPIRIWVYISQKFNSRDVFLQILQTFSSQDMSKMEHHELVKTVTACLEKEKFLLVLDAVWSVEAWNEIKVVLPPNNGKSKVLITSREMQVGNRSSTTQKPHKLRFLTEKESWTLLQYEVFGNEEDCPEELRLTGRHIAAKCDGVPLTIVVVGGILMDQLTPSTDETKKEWEVVGENVSRAIKKEQRIVDAVDLSYHRLPDDLRECFVYMGVFPKDYEIPAKMLMGLWIAEGFIRPKDGKSFEQSAEDNLKDLIGRNLLKAEQMNHMGRVKTCRVHDMIRAFCIARSDEENLFQEVKKSNATGEFDPPVSENSHRLCIHSHLSKFLFENPKGPRVRSFLCFYEQPIYLEPQFINVIPDGFPKLRVMESKSIIFHQYPAKVAKLIHLRYITLFIENPTNPGQQTNLPKEISELWNLQNLVVQTKSRTIEVKANIWKMIRLRHLKTTAAIVLLDNKIEGEGGLNLQTLDRLSADSCTEAVSKRAKNLRTLGISGKLANVFRSNFLENLEHLEKLKLVNSIPYEATSDDRLSLPQQPNCFPQFLKSLTLRNTNLEWQPNMSALANIKTLEALKLKDNAFKGVTWEVSGYNFPKLQLLLIVNTNLVIWNASKDTFPKLRFLVVKNCASLMEIPSCLGARLEKLEIERLCESAVESARAIGEQRKVITEGKLTVPFILKIGPVCEKNK